jgi:hypothetical protein
VDCIWDGDVLCVFLELWRNRIIFTDHPAGTLLAAVFLRGVGPIGDKRQTVEVEDEEKSVPGS